MTKDAELWHAYIKSLELTIEIADKYLEEIEPYPEDRETRKCRNKMINAKKVVLQLVESLKRA